MRQPTTILKDFRSYWDVLLIFALVALVVAGVAPSTKGFQYQFSQGRPWQYDLLTAPYDFPIYKTDQQLQHEQDSITSATRPVYIIDESVASMMIAELQDEYQARLSERVPMRYYNYVHARLVSLYKRGLIPADQLTALRSQGRLEVQLRSGDFVERIPITRFYSLKEAYDYIIDSIPPGLKVEMLEQMNLGHYIRDNVVYDEAFTQRLMDESLGHISLSTGMVQLGERIIGPGEIVTAEVYNILRSLAREHDKRSGGALQQHTTRIGVFITLSLLFGLVALYLIYLVPSFDSKRKNFLLLGISSLLLVVLTALNVHYGWFNVYIIPYVMLPILWRIFFSSSTALVSYIAVVLASAIFVSEPLTFIFIQMLGGVSALVSLQNLSSRGQMIKAAFVVYLSYTITALGLRLIGAGAIDSSYWLIQVYFAINLVLLMFTYILAFVVERAFGYVSNVSLVELSDINSPLLRELSEVAPGTFQHSLQVSILASEAASKIGGDVSLIRTGALYHDIGKIKAPAYFTENQGGSNPHDLIDAEESARIIIRHVTDGIALAQKHNLPTPIIDFIRTHHGNGMTKYFYLSEQNAHPEREIDPSPYTYPGPNPWTKEQGILMLADAVEASSRSLKEYTEDSIRKHVWRIVDGIVAEGYLNDTPITFRDIQQIKAVFIAKLRTMYHTRISYPEKR